MHDHKLSIDMIETIQDMGQIRIYGTSEYGKFRFNAHVQEVYQNISYDMEYQCFQFSTNIDKYVKFYDRDICVEIAYDMDMSCQLIFLVYVYQQRSVGLNLMVLVKGLHVLHNLFTQLVERYVVGTNSNHISWDLQRMRCMIEEFFYTHFSQWPFIVKMRQKGKGITTNFFGGLLSLCFYLVQPSSC